MADNIIEQLTDEAIKKSQQEEVERQKQEQAELAAQEQQTQIDTQAQAEVDARVEGGLTNTDIELLQTFGAEVPQQQVQPTPEPTQETPEQTQEQPEQTPEKSDPLTNALTNMANTVADIANIARGNNIEQVTEDTTEQPTQTPDTEIPDANFVTRGDDGGPRDDLMRSMGVNEIIDNVVPNEDNPQPEPAPVNQEKVEQAQEASRQEFERLEQQPSTTQPQGTYNPVEGGVTDTDLELIDMVENSNFASPDYGSVINSVDTSGFTVDVPDYAAQRQAIANSSSGYIVPNVYGGGSNGGISDVDAAMNFLREHEGLKTTAYEDINDSGKGAGYRVGYGSDTITRADGSVVNVTKGMTISKQDAERDLQRRVINDFIPQVKGVIGEAAYNRLSSAQKAAFIGMAYRGDIYAGKDDAVKKAMQSDIANGDFNFNGVASVLNERGARAAKNGVGGLQGRFNTQIGMLQQQGGGQGGPIQASPTGYITQDVSNSPLAKAAQYATTRAEKGSIGLCAKYVRLALQNAGYKFQAQPSAYMYHSKGVLKDIGFSEIPQDAERQVGDIIVFDKATRNTGGKPQHGHIAIWNGQNWVSDFVQNNKDGIVDGKRYDMSMAHIYRDNNYTTKGQQTNFGGYQVPQQVIDNYNQRQVQQQQAQQVQQQGVYASSDQEGKPLTIQNANYDYMLQKLGYSGIGGTGTLSDENKKDILGQYAQQLYRDEKKRLEGTGIENIARTAKSRVVAQIPDAWEALGYDAPQVQTADVDKYSVQGLRNQVTSLVGESGGSLQMGSVLQQLAANKVKTEHKGITDDSLKRQLIREETQRYYDQLGDIKGMTVNDFMSAEESSFAPAPVDENGNTVTTKPPGKRDGVFTYSINQSQSMMYKGLQTFGEWINSETITNFAKKGAEDEERQIAEGGYQSKYGNLSWDETYQQHGVFGWLGKAKDTVLENSASVGVGVVGGGIALAAGAVSAPVGLAIGGGAAALSGLEMAGDVRSELEDQDLYDPNNAGEVILVSGLFGSLDVISGGVGSKAARKALLMPAIKEAVESGAFKQAADAINDRIATRAVAGGLKSGVTEASTEVLQEYGLMSYVKSQGGEYEDEIDRLISAAIGGGGIGFSAGSVQGAFANQTETTSNTPETPDDGGNPPTSPTTTPVNNEPPEFTDTLTTNTGKTFTVRDDGAMTRGEGATFTSGRGTRKTQNNAVVSGVSVNTDTGEATFSGDIADLDVKISLGGTEPTVETNEILTTRKKPFKTEQSAEKKIRALGGDTDTTKYKPVEVEGGFKIVQTITTGGSSGGETTVKLPVALQSGDREQVKVATETLLRETGIKVSVNADTGLMTLDDIKDESGQALTAKVGSSYDSDNSAVPVEKADYSAVTVTEPTDDMDGLSKLIDQLTNNGSDTSPTEQFVTSGLSKDNDTWGVPKPKFSDNNKPDTVGEITAYNNINDVQDVKIQYIEDESVGNVPVVEYDQVNNTMKVTTTKSQMQANSQVEDGEVGEIDKVFNIGLRNLIKKRETGVEDVNDNDSLFTTFVEDLNGVKSYDPETGTVVLTDETLNQTVNEDGTGITIGEALLDKEFDIESLRSAINRVTGLDELEYEINDNGDIIVKGFETTNENADEQQTELTDDPDILIDVDSPARGLGDLMRLVHPTSTLQDEGTYAYENASASVKSFADGTGATVVANGSIKDSTGLASLESLINSSSEARMYEPKGVAIQMEQKDGYNRFGKSTVRDLTKQGWIVTDKYGNRYIDNGAGQIITYGRDGVAKLPFTDNDNQEVKDYTTGKLTIMKDNLVYEVKHNNPEKAGSINGVRITVTNQYGKDIHEVSDAFDSAKNPGVTIGPSSIEFIAEPPLMKLVNDKKLGWRFNHDRMKEGKPLDWTIERNGKVLRMNDTTVRIGENSLEVSVGDEITTLPLVEGYPIVGDNALPVNYFELLMRNGRLIESNEDWHVFDVNGNNYAIDRENNLKIYKGVFDDKGDVKYQLLKDTSEVLGENTAYSNASKSEAEIDFEQEHFVETVKEIQEQINDAQVSANGDVTVTNQDGSTTTVVTDQTDPQKARDQATLMLQMAMVQSRQASEILDVESLEGEIYTGSEEQVRLLKAIADTFPSEIAQRIQWEEQKLGSVTTANRAWGIFSPFSSRGPRIYMDIHTTGNRTMASIIRTLSEEVSHYGEFMSRHAWTADVYQAIWSKLENTIMTSPELQYYIPVDKDGNQIDPNSDFAIRDMLINEFFSKQGVSIINFRNIQANIPGLDNAALNDLSNQIDSIVTKGVIKIRPNPGTGLSDAEFAQQIARPLVTSMMARTSGASGVTLSIQGTNTIIRGKRYGNSVSRSASDRENKTVNRILRHTGSSKVAWTSSWNTFWDRIWFNIQAMFRPEIGSLNNHFMAMTDRQMVQSFNNQYKPVVRAKNKVHAALAGVGFTGNIPVGRSYHQVMFEDYGLPRTKKNIARAELIDNFIENAETQKRINLFNIHAEFDRTFQIISGSHAVPSAEDLVKIRRDLMNQKNRMLEDWSHRRYDVHTEQGQKRLNIMARMLKKDEKDLYVQQLERNAQNEILRKQKLPLLKPIAGDGWREVTTAAFNKIDGKLKGDPALHQKWVDARRKLKDDIKLLDDELAAGSISPRQHTEDVNTLNYEFLQTNRISPEVDREMLKVLETLQMQERLDALYSYVTSEINDPKNKLTFANADEVNREIAKRMENIVNQYLNDPDNPGRNMSTSSGSVSAVESFKARKLDKTVPRDQLLMKFLGEMTSPVDNLLHDIEQQLKLQIALANGNKVGKMFVDAGMGGFSARPDKARNPDISRFKNTAMGYVEFTEAGLTDVVKGMIDVNQLVPKNLFGDITATVKGNFTIYNLGTAVLNWISGLTLMTMDGSFGSLMFSREMQRNLASGIMGVAHSTVHGGFGENRTDFIKMILNEMQELGLLESGADIVLADFVKGNIGEKVATKLWEMAGRESGRQGRREQIRDVMEVIKSFYGAGDDIAKILPYMISRELGMKRARTKIDRSNYNMDYEGGRQSYQRALEQHAKDYALRKTIAGTIHYPSTPYYIRKMLNQPGPQMILGTFIVHPTQWLRIVGQSFYSIVEESKELRQLNARKAELTADEREYQKALAIRVGQRVMGVGIVNGGLAAKATGAGTGLFSAILTQVAQLMFDDDDEEGLTGVEYDKYVAMSEVMAYFTPSGQPIVQPLWVKGKNGYIESNMNRADITASLYAHGDFDPDANLVDHFKKLSLGIASNFINLENDGVPAQIMDTIQLKNTMTGDKLTLESGVNQALNMALPKTLNDAIAVMRGRTLYGTDVNRGQKLSQMMLGVKLKEVPNDDYISKLGWKYREAMKDEPNLTSLNRNLKSGIELSDNEIVGGIQDVLKARQKRYNEITYIRERMQIAGFTDNEIEDQLSSISGVTGEMVDAIMGTGPDPAVSKLMTTLTNKLDKFYAGEKVYGRDSEDMEQIIANYERAIEKLEQYSER